MTKIRRLAAQPLNTLTLDDAEGFLKRGFTVRGRMGSLEVKLEIVGLIFLEHIVNGGQERPGNGDNRCKAGNPDFQRTEWK